ncbi:replication initiation factor [Brevibacillus centrosporus]|uniref:replication initiation factor n=1 Tax=Brevibacillus centrosporus TaxID=54910 RepID=UPI003986E614
MILRGFDTIVFGINIENYDSVFRKHLDRFKEMKAIAQETGIEHTVYLNDLSLTVHRTGIRFYQYNLSCNDFIISFAEKELKTNAPITVKFLSSYIWSFGLEGAFSRFSSWLESISTSIIGTKVSRADICADTDLVTFKEIDIKGVVTLARKRQKYFVDGEYAIGREFSGFTIGKGSPLQARVYNKSIEIPTSGKAWFKEIWLANNWCEDKEVWRVEFQMMRNVLKEFSINTVEDLIKKESTLWAYLTQQWLTIRQPSPDKVYRWKLKKKWKTIQEAGNDYNTTPLVREKVLQGSIQSLLDQGAGILLSVAAIGDHESLEDTLQVFKSWAEIALNKKNTSFHSEKERRQKKYLLT